MRSDIPLSGFGLPEVSFIDSGLVRATTYLIIASKAKTCILHEFLQSPNSNPAELRTHIRTAAAKDEPQHNANSQPLWYSLDEYASNQCHDFGRRRPLIVYPIHLRLFERRGSVDFLWTGFDPVHCRRLEVSQSRTSSRRDLAEHRGGRRAATVSSGSPGHRVASNKKRFDRGGVVPLAPPSKIRAGLAVALDAR